MKLVYLGTPEIAVAPLDALVAAGHEVRLVVTGPDRRRGRGGATSPSPVKAAALEYGLTVSHDVNDVADIGEQVDLGVVVAFGQIIRPNVLDRVDLINVHFSALPRWRGAAPVERAILAGDMTTAVCIMQVAAGLDTGDVFASEVVPIGPTLTASELRQEMVDIGSRLLVNVLANGPGGLPTPQAQVGEPTYARKFTADELRIDWSADPVDIDRLIRIGGAWTTFRGERIKVHAAELVDGVVVPTEVQAAGKPRTSYDSWRNGARPGPGEVFV